eukprot:m.60937 g.60937  ORF g.60937 m.60937 type:complete len:320 (+) comp7971_c0_seq4:69-1028(+)
MGVVVGQFVWKAVQRLTPICGSEREAFIAAREIVRYVYGEKSPHSPAAIFSCTNNGSDILTSSQLQLATDMVEKRYKHCPLQYILGEWDFRYLTLAIKPPVLIPRQETEVLVDHLLNYHNTVNVSSSPSLTRSTHFVEIGVGSGAISLSLIHEGLGNWIGEAYDIDPAAIALASQNTNSYQYQDRFQVYNLDVCNEHASRVIATNASKRSNFIDIIVSNPPYITSDEMNLLDEEVRNYESHQALHGGHDGLDVARCILQCASSKRIFHKDLHIWLELAGSQPPIVESLIKNTYDDMFRVKSIFEDQYGIPRFMHITANQ